MRQKHSARAWSAAVAGLVIAGLLPAVAGASAGHARFSSTASLSDGSAGSAAARAMRQGYLVPDQAGYDRAKARANAASVAPVRPESAANPLAPVTVRGWSGIFDGNSAPSDSTSSVG